MNTFRFQVNKLGDIYSIEFVVTDTFIENMTDVEDILKRTIEDKLDSLYGELLYDK